MTQIAIQMNHRNFLDEIAKQLKIQIPSDWGKISVKHFYELGGRTLLNNNNGSLLVCLQSVYKGIHLRIFFSFKKKT